MNETSRRAASGCALHDTSSGSPAGGGDALDRASVGRVRALRWWLVLVLLLSAACGGRSSGERDLGLPGDAAGNFDTNVSVDATDDTGADTSADTSLYPPPNKNLVGTVGGDQTLDVATWNLRQFPATASTIKTTADLVASMDLDLIAVQEITDDAAFDELVARLPGYAGVLSTHVFPSGEQQKDGLLYKTSAVKVSNVELLFEGEYDIFPRPPVQALVTVESSSVDFTIIVVHLKAGVQQENRDKRRLAIKALETYVRSRVDGPFDNQIMILGDFNQDLDDDDSGLIWGPFLDNADRYSVLTVATKNAGKESYLPFHRMLDHIVITSALDQEAGNEAPLVPDLNVQLNNYQDLVSDHLPVVLRMPITP
ncbi:MAG: endonuclease/exonuclease/phosphatase family protein [Myxococcales bacterium]|nr:endonuclease/exonuclease/phosphatase family protein [Myxococcales bacterium]